MVRSPVEAVKVADREEDAVVAEMVVMAAEVVVVGKMRATRTWTTTARHVSSVAERVKRSVRGAEVDAVMVADRTVVAAEIEETEEIVAREVTAEIEAIGASVEIAASDLLSHEPVSHESRW